MLDSDLDQEDFFILKPEMMHLFICVKVGSGVDSRIIGEKKYLVN